MSWLRAARADLPHVPQDDRERMKLLVESESRLAEVLDNDAVVRDVSIPLRVRNDQNHYAQALRLAFGVAPAK